MLCSTSGTLVLALQLCCEVTMHASLEPSTAGEKGCRLQDSGLGVSRDSGPGFDPLPGLNRRVVVGQSSVATLDFCFEKL